MAKTNSARIKCLRTDRNVCVRINLFAHGSQCLRTDQCLSIFRLWAAFFECFLNVLSHFSFMGSARTTLIRKSVTYMCRTQGKGCETQGVHHEEA